MGDNCPSYNVKRVPFSYLISILVGYFTGIFISLLFPSSIAGSKLNTLYLLDIFMKNLTIYLSIIVLHKLSVKELVAVLIFLSLSMGSYFAFLSMRINPLLGIFTILLVTLEVMVTVLVLTRISFVVILTGVVCYALLSILEVYGYNMILNVG